MMTVTGSAAAAETSIVYGAAPSTQISAVISALAVAVAGFVLV